MEDKKRKLDNIASIGEIATGVKETPEERAVLKDYAEGRITGSEADSRLIGLAKKGS